MSKRQLAKAGKAKDQPKISGVFKKAQTSSDFDFSNGLQFKKTLSPLINPKLLPKANKKKPQTDSKSIREKFPPPENLQPSKTFTSYSSVVLSLISQGYRQCAGISIGAIKEFINNSEVVDEHNKRVIAKRIRDEGTQFYELGRAMEPNEVGTGENEGFIELKSIFSRRTFDHRNEIDVNDEMTIKLRFQTAHSALKYQEEGQMPIMDSYFEGFRNEKFSDIVRRNNLENSPNFIIYSLGHYITVVRREGHHLVVDGNPHFQFYTYESFDNLLMDIDNYLTGTHYNFYIAQIIQCQPAIEPSRDQQIITISDSESDDENEKFLTPPEALYMIDYDSDYDDEKVENDEDSDNDELDEAVRFMLSNEEPQYSKTPAKQGICKWGMCEDKVYRSDNFCKFHWLKLKSDRYKISKHMKVRCQFGDGTCKATVRYNQQFCIAHRDKTFDLASKNERKSDAELRSEAKVALENFIEPIANDKIQFYVGRTPHLQRRLNIHIHEFNLKGANTKHLEIHEIVKVRGVTQANELENFLINECVFSENENVREMLVNRIGGGSFHQTVCAQDCDYSVYVLYDPTDTVKFRKSNLADGNLNRQQMKEIFYRSIDSRGVKEKLSDDIGVKFGISYVGGLQDRMSSYNVGNEDTKSWKCARIKSENFKKCVLIKSGDKFKLADGTTVTVNDADIIRFELLAIYEFSLGESEAYKNFLVNNHGGGASSEETKEKLLYFRYFKKNKEPKASQGKLKDQNYLNRAVPRDDEGKIDWKALIPTWKVVLLSKSLLQVRKEGKNKCVCGKSFSWPSNLRYHMLTCVKAGGDNTRVPCTWPDCKLTFSTERNLKRHIKRMHEKDDVNRRSKAASNKHLKKAQKGKTQKRSTQGKSQKGRK